MSSKPTYEELENRIRELEQIEVKYKKTQNDLQKAIINYHTVFDSANDAIFIYDLEDGSILDVNQKMLEMYGYTKNEVIHKGVGTFGEGISPYSRDEAEEIFRKAAEGKPQVFEWKAKKKNGTVFWVEVSLNKVILDGEERLISIIRDIDSRKQTEKSLLDSQERFRLIFDNIDIGIAIFEAVENGRDFIFKEINPYGANVRKMRREDHIEQRVTDVYPGVKEIGLFDVLYKVWQTGLAQNHPVCNYKDGSLTLWVENYVSKLPSGEVMSVYRDITAERKAEVTLKERRAFLKRVIDQSPFAIWISDSEGTLMHANPALKKFLNLTDDQLVGKYNVLKDPLIKKQGLLPLINTVYQNGNTINFRCKWDGKDIPTMDLKGSKEVHIEATMFPIQNSQGKLTNVILSWIDISERIKAEEELHLLNQELEMRIQQRTAEIETKNRELETFTYSVSHDLKAPLRGIDGYSRLLVEEYSDRLDEEGLRFLSNIRNSTEQMHQLIEDLLTYSRMERRDLRFSQVDIRQLIDELIFEREHEISSRSVQIKTDISIEHMVCDRDSMRQILGNLLDNAIKFSRDKSDAKIEINGRETSDTWSVSVKDNGIGFDAKYSERIFGIFQRLHHSEDYPGTGVGLALVQKAVQRMGGQIRAEGRLEKGAVFYLEIPKTLI